jgi:hypothetical protein
VTVETEKRDALPAPAEFTSRVRGRTHSQQGRSAPAGSFLSIVDQLETGLQTFGTNRTFRAGDSRLSWRGHPATESAAGRRRSSSVARSHNGRLRMLPSSRIDVSTVPSVRHCGAGYPSAVEDGEAGILRRDTRRRRRWNERSGVADRRFRQDSW